LYKSTLSFHSTSAALFHTVETFEVETANGDCKTGQKLPKTLSDEY
jgi:hypothetical protein